MKRIITLVLAVMTAVSLVACGDKASATVDAEALGRALAERVQFDTTVSAIDPGNYLDLPQGCSAMAFMSDGSTMEEIFVVSCKDKTDASAVKIAMQELLDRRDMALNPQLTVFEDIVKREPYSVEEKAEEIVQRVKLAGITRFLLLFKGSRSRSELVATFMAVLELCKKHVLRLAGGPEDCMVSCSKENEV